MKYIVIGLGLQLVFFNLQAQVNLIRNWSFEQLRDTTSLHPCPTSPGQIAKSKHWNSANSSVDYFNGCSNDTFPNFGVPFNFKGFQEAFEGEAYANFACYSIFFPDAKEYLWHELDTPLVGGLPYVCRFRVSLADSVNFALGSMGALISVGNTRFWNNIQLFFNAEPQIQNPVNELLDDKEQWMTISGQFVAQGGEKYVTIGSFVPDSMGNIQRVSNFPQIGENWEYSSYLVDGVELYADNNKAASEPTEVGFQVYPNPARNSLTVTAHMDESTVATIRITDVFGVSVRSEMLRCGFNQLDLSRLSSGIYYYVILINGDIQLQGKQVIVK